MSPERVCENEREEGDRTLSHNSLERKSRTLYFLEQAAEVSVDSVVPFQALRFPEALY